MTWQDDARAEIDRAHAAQLRPSRTATIARAKALEGVQTITANLQLLSFEVGRQARDRAAAEARAAEAQAAHEAKVAERKALAERAAKAREARHV